MKAAALFFLILAAAAPLAPVSCSKPPAERETKPKTLYTCGMHPQIVQDHPGDCPICGMRLEPVRQETAAPSSGASAPHIPVVITIDPVTIQNMGIRTEAVTRGPLNKKIRTVGAIDYDETALTDVTVKFKGWIEQLFAGATGQPVKAGDPLFEIYSPELVSAQDEYLAALGSNSPGLKESALRRLRNFDVSGEQIAELERARKARQTLQITAPRGGIVVEKTAVRGAMADAGMRLYRLADLSNVWVLAQIYEQDLPYVKTGQRARISLTYLPGEAFEGRVAYVYPALDDKSRTGRVRIEVPNPGLVLKPGMFAQVELTADLEGDAVLVPDSAVLRSGEKNTVFIALEGGKFEPREIVPGPRGEGGVYQVLSGLSGGERVVISGQFMLDSESQFKEAIQKMREPGRSHEP